MADEVALVTSSWDEVHFNNRNSHEVNFFGIGMFVNPFKITFYTNIQY